MEMDAKQYVESLKEFERKKALVESLLPEAPTLPTFEFESNRSRFLLSVSAHGELRVESWAKSETDCLGRVDDIVPVETAGELRRWLSSVFDPGENREGKRCQDQKL